VITGLRRVQATNGQCLAEDIGLPVRYRPARILVSADADDGDSRRAVDQHGLREGRRDLDRPARDHGLQQENGGWLCTTHTCRSIAACRQQSYANRPVKSA